MANRANNMATIAAALAAANEPTKPPQSINAPNVPIAPGVNAPAPLSELTADQKRAFDANRQTQRDALEQQEKSQLQQAMAAREQQVQADAEQDAFERSAAATASSAQRIATGAKVRLASIPTPGSIVLPLIILIVFFVLLLPVNGHTRLVWLWMVLSGNAIVGQDTTGSAQNSDQSGQHSSNNSTSTPAVLPVTISPAPIFPYADLMGSIGSTGTYVEGSL
jgi:hypothetical protein